MTFLRHLAPLLAVMTLGCAHSAAPAAAAPAQKINRVESYISRSFPGFRLDLVIFEGPEERGVFRVSNSNSEFDGVSVPFTSRFDNWTARLGRWRGANWAVLRENAKVRYAYTPNRQEIRLEPAPGAPIDPAPILQKLAEAQQDGTLKRFETFDRAKAISEHERELARGAEAAMQACQRPIAFEVGWASFPDAQLEWGESTAAGCGEVLDTLKELCGWSAVRERLVARVQKVRCEYVASVEGLEAFKIDGGTLHVKVAGAGTVAARSSSFLLVDGQSKAPRTPFPWQDDASTLEHAYLDAMTVCRDDRGHLLALGPVSSVLGNLAITEQPDPQLYVGDAQGLVVVPRPEGYGSKWIYNDEARWFMDGRFEGALPDTKSASKVEFEQGTGACKVSCGRRSVVVPKLPKAEAAKVLLGAKLLPSPFKRAPHALLRDGAGAYYYVDTGSEPERAKDFRVFVGQRGALKQLKMTNTLADSEGQIFSTKGGDLRLVLDRARPSTWRANGKTVQLRDVPVADNLDVIFAQLGVYAGERLGTPCDDF